jgi:hypothetical protein
MALRYIEALWKQEGRTAVPPIVAVGAMGYGALSGTARVVLGALRQFGLLEKTSQGMKLSDLAVRILHPASDEDRQEAIREAASLPLLFREMARTHGKASDAAISSYLVTQRHFAPRGVREFTKAFRDTIALAGLQDAGYNQPRQQDMIPSVNPPAAPAGPPLTQGSTAGVLLLKVPFLDDELTVRVESAKGPLTALHIGRVRRYLELAEDDLKLATKGNKFEGA